LAQSVQIDIKPGSDNNTSNIASNGVTTVALFTTPGFLASQVDIASVLFAGAHVDHYSLSDIDQDGDLDLVMHFRTADTSLSQIYNDLLTNDLNGDGTLSSTNQVAEVRLTGNTLDGNAFQGDDTINLFLSGKALREVLDQLFGGGT
jgi:hypothetical protein